MDDRVGLLLTGSPGVREVILELSATMNDFLATAAAVVRDRFGGRITYAAVPPERVDWAPFDIVSVDLYRSREIADRFTDGVRLPGPAVGAEGRVHRGRRVVPVNAS